MIPKNGYRFSEKIMLQSRSSSADRIACAAARLAMPAAPDSAGQIEAAFHRVMASRVITILAKLAHWWPQTLLGLGVILTFLWSGVLVWWLMAIVGLI